MSIKVANPKNSLLVEGLWGTGKTKLAEYYAGSYGYKIASEPWHTHEAGAEYITDIDEWYLSKHKKRQTLFEGSSELFMERSVLSSFAFLYALGKPLPPLADLQILKAILEKNEVMVVYLLEDEESAAQSEESLAGYSESIQMILSDPQLRKRYQEWYTKILPRDYGILPFMLRLSINGVRRSTEELAADIHLALACRRVAQINAVCYHGSGDEMKILTLKRNPDKGGFWQTVTGGIHPGEDPYKAAKREVFEELSLPENSFRTFLTPTTYAFTGDDGYILDEYVFGCEISDPTLVKLSEEHAESKWLDLKEARDLVKYENNKEAIDALAEIK